MLGSAISRRWVVSLALVGLVSLFMATFSANWANPASATTGTTVPATNTPTPTNTPVPNDKLGGVGDAANNVVAQFGDITVPYAGTGSSPKVYVHNTQNNNVAGLPNVTINTSSSNTGCVTSSVTTQYSQSNKYGMIKYTRVGTGCSADITVMAHQGTTTVQDVFKVTVGQDTSGTDTSTGAASQSAITSESSVTNTLTHTANLITSLVAPEPVTPSAPVAPAPPPIGAPENRVKLATTFIASGAVSTSTGSTASPADTTGVSLGIGAGTSLTSTGSNKPVNRVTFRTYESAFNVSSTGGAGALTVSDHDVQTVTTLGGEEFVPSGFGVDVVFEDEDGNAIPGVTLDSPARMCVTASALGISNPGQAHLYHGSDAGWTKLNTQLVGPNEGYFMACAWTSSFSPFVIGVEPVVIEEEETDAGASLPATGDYSPNGLILLLAAFAGVAMVGAGAVAARRVRRSES